MEQVLFEQHVRLVNGVNKVFHPRARTVLEVVTFLVAVVCAIALFILHIIYVTNSSNSNVNCLMTYFDSHNISKPSIAKYQYDLIKLTVTPSIDQLKSERLEDQYVRSDGRIECSADSANNVESCANVNSPAFHVRDKVYLFALERGALMLADDTIAKHNFTMLDISFPSDATCFGPPLTSHILRKYLGYDLIVMNWAVAALDGEGFMYKAATRELFNLNYAGDFVSKKGMSLMDEKLSVRYKDPLLLPTLVVDALSHLGLVDAGLATYHVIMSRLGAVWSQLEESESFKPVTQHLAWVFADEFSFFDSLREAAGVSAGDAGSTSGGSSSAKRSTNSLFNLIYSAATITNTRWTYISQSFPKFNQYFMFRAGVIFSTTFLFFVTTTLVSYTLRETQERMLRFTYQLQHHINNNLPYWSLVFTHLVESLVFVPIIVGIHFFLVEFFSDQLVSVCVRLFVIGGALF